MTEISRIERRSRFCSVLSSPLWLSKRGLGYWSVAKESFTLGFDSLSSWCAGPLAAAMVSIPNPDGTPCALILRLDFDEQRERRVPQSPHCALLTES